MSQRVYVNNFKTTLTSDVTASTDTLLVASTAALTSQLTTLTNGQSFLVTLDDGVKYEVVEVRAFSSGVLGSCVRGRENTTAQDFTQGTRVEARVTAGTLSAFARLIDRLADVTSVDAVPAAASADSNSYLTGSLDEDGNPVIALRCGSLWRFSTHATAIRSGTLTATGTTTSMNIGTTSFMATSSITSGGYIVQITSGALSGTCRMITGAGASTISWNTAFPSAPALGATYTIYQSISTTLATVSSIQDDSIAISLTFAE